jgi:RNA polymerase sigma-70 factor, ECF subfamily
MPRHQAKIIRLAMPLGSRLPVSSAACHGGESMSAEFTSADSESEVALRIAADIYCGDRAAEARLYTRYRDGLRHIIRRRTGDPDLADDLVQDTFRIALEHLRRQQLEDPTRLAGYLRGIALNLLTAEQRKSSRRATVADTDRVDGIANDDRSQFDALSSAEVVAVVRNLLAELKVERDRDVLFRVYVLQEDKECICRALNLDALHFNRVLHRAKLRFRDLLVAAERRQKMRLLE